MKNAKTTVGRRLFLATAAGAATSLAIPFIARHAIAQSRPAVRIINTSSNTVRTMQALLKQQGYLEEFGVDAITMNVSDGTKVMGSLLSGEVDICMLSGFAQTLAAIEKGARLKIVAGGLLRSNSVIYSGRPEIQSLKDLEGRSIGAGAIDSGLHMLVVTLLRKRGVDLSKVTFVNIGSGTDVFKSVAARTVDAGPAQVEFLEDAKKYNVHPLSDGAFWEQLPEYSDQGSYTADRAIAEKRDALVRVLAAYGKLYRFVSSPGSKDAYLEARKAALGPKADMAGGVALWEFIQKFQPYAQNLAITEPRIRFVQELNVEARIQKAVQPYAKVADMSLARDAVKMMGGPVASAD